MLGVFLLAKKERLIVLISETTRGSIEQRNTTLNGTTHFPHINVVLCSRLIESVGKESKYSRSCSKKYTNKAQSYAKHLADINDMVHSSTKKYGENLDMRWSSDKIKNVNSE